MLGTALFISYFFPPVGGVGTIRAVKFIRYLEEYGWRVVVIAVKEPAYAFYDESLFEQIPDSTIVYRTQAIQPTAAYFRKKREQAAQADTGTAASRHGLKTLIRHLGRTVVQAFLLPDDKVGWIPFAVRQGTQAIERHDIDVIFSSGPPFTVHLIADRLSRRSGTPWVADFRDPMLEKNPVAQQSAFHRWLFTRWERRWVEKAAHVISVTGRFQNLFTQRHPDIDPERWVVITNGYDEADFAALDTTMDSPTDTFELHYVGSLYRGVVPDLRPLLGAVRQLVDAIPDARQQFRLIFTGNIDNHFQEQITQASQQHGIDDMVVMNSSVAHKDALSRMLNACAVMLTLSEDQQSDFAIRVKLFEYLRAKKPILALLPPEAAAKLQAVTNEAKALVNAGKPRNQYDLLFAMDDVHLISAQAQDVLFNRLREWFQQWQADTLSQPINAGHEQFERRALTGKLAELFDRVSSKGIQT